MSLPWLPWFELKHPCIAHFDDDGAEPAALLYSSRLAESSAATSALVPTVDGAVEGITFKMPKAIVFHDNRNRQDTSPLKSFLQVKGEAIVTEKDDEAMAVSKLSIETCAFQTRSDKTLLDYSLIDARRRSLSDTD